MEHSNEEEPKAILYLTQTEVSLLGAALMLATTNNVYNEHCGADNIRGVVQKLAFAEMDIEELAA